MLMEDLAFPPFQAASAAVATFELRVRLLADLEPDGSKLQRAAIAGDLTELVDGLCDRYEATEPDRALLRGVAGIRNHLFHLKLSRVAGRITPLAEQLLADTSLGAKLRQGGGVVMANLETGAVEHVAKTSTERGRIFGWMLESAGSGAFAAVVEVVRRALAVLTGMRDKAIADAIAALAPPGSGP